MGRTGRRRGPSTTRGAILEAARRRFAVRHLFVQLTGLVGGPQGELRVNLAAAHLIGVAVLRYALRVEPIASASVDELVAWLTPSLTHYLGPESSDRGERVPCADA